MIKYIAVLFILSGFYLPLKAQTGSKDQFFYTASISTGLAMSTPSSVPLILRGTAGYSIYKRLSVGIGSGISLYDKFVLIPVLGRLKFLLIKPHKFVPYIDCEAGYSFAPSSRATGGFCLSPSVGVQTKITDKMDVFLAVGYEVQNLKRLKEHDGVYFHTEFEETLKHHSITLKAGIVF